MDSSAAASTEFGDGGAPTSRPGEFVLPGRPSPDAFSPGDADPDYGHDCGPDCACFGERFAELRKDVRDFPTGEVRVDAQELAALLAAYDDALHGRELARLDAENERRLARG